jgi:hypothetical protein
MTVHVPVRLVFFVLYSAAILVGAFGISYGVFEWRDDGEGSATELAALDYRISFVRDNFNSRVDALRTDLGALSPSGDSTACHLALRDLTVNNANSILGDITPSEAQAKAIELAGTIAAEC